MPEKKKCLIYTRIRTLPQNDTLERQMEFLRRYAEQQGYTIVGEATDLAGVQAASQSYSFDVLAVTGLSQMGRDMESVQSFMDGLSASGQAIHSMKEGLISPDAFKLVAMTAAVYQELEATAEAMEAEEGELEERCFSATRLSESTGFPIPSNTAVSLSHKDMAEPLYTWLSGSSGWQFSQYHCVKPEKHRF